jgi:hypothetical protein
MGLITSLLLPELYSQFPESDMEPGRDPEPIAIFPCAHEYVGDIEIWDEGDSVSLAIGDLARGDFGPYGPGYTNEERARRIVEEVSSFLERLFNDEVLIWATDDEYEGRPMGGWEPIRGNLSLSKSRSGILLYLWSGPIDKDGNPVYMDE